MDISYVDVPLARIQVQSDAQLSVQLAVRTSDDILSSSSLRKSVAYTCSGADTALVAPLPVSAALTDSSLSLIFHHDAPAPCRMQSVDV